MSRAQNILWENRDTIEQMMQQMDDFANANGGYINRSGVGNFKTQPKVEEEDKAKKPGMSNTRRNVRASVLGGAGAGAAYLAGRHPDLIKKGLVGAGKVLKTAAKHYGIGG